MVVVKSPIWGKSRPGHRRRTWELVMGIVSVEVADETAQASASAETVGVQTVGTRAGVETSSRRLGVQLDRRCPW